MKIHQVQTSEKLDEHRKKLVQQFRLLKRELMGASDDAVARLAIDVVKQAEEENTQ